VPTATPETDLAAQLAALQTDRDKWKGHARDWEGKAKANAQSAEDGAKRDAAIRKIAAELGLPVDTKADPEAIARELAAAKVEKAMLARERAVLLAAHAAGADPAALLDSRAFLAALEKIDPSDTGALAEAVKAAVAANPRYATAAPAPAAPAPPQASTAGGFDAAPGTARQLTAADVDRMTPAQVAKAHRDGLLKSYLGS
jgi:hypothetical protein